VNYVPLLLKLKILNNNVKDYKHWQVTTIPEYDLYVSYSSNQLRSQESSIEYKTNGVSINPNSFYYNTEITMGTGNELRLLKLQIQEIIDNKLYGDVYETGVWREGTSIYIVGYFRAYEYLNHVESRRRYNFFDSFSGFTKKYNTENYASEPLMDYLINWNFFNDFNAPLPLVKHSFKFFLMFLMTNTFILLKVISRRRSPH